MIDPVEKAATLIEALPYLKKFAKSKLVIKYGGNAMENEEQQKSIIDDILFLHYMGISIILVHGGGPDITSLMNKMGKESSFINGLRVTDQETMEIVEMVLLGKINSKLVKMINKNGVKALGLSGKDCRLIQAEKKFADGSGYEPDDHQQIDIGFVGEVKAIDKKILDTVISKNYIPVIAPVGIGPDGESYNINADHVAGEIAAAINAEKLIFLTDVSGICRKRGKTGTAAAAVVNQEPTVKKNGDLLSSVTIDEVRNMIENQEISGGMIPKAEACVNALLKGVKKTHIIDGRIPHALLLELFTDEGIGTEVIIKGAMS